MPGDLLENHEAWLPSLSTRAGEAGPYIQPGLSVWLLAAIDVCFALFLNASGFLTVGSITDAEFVYKQEAILLLSLLSGVLLVDNYHSDVRLLPITVKTQSFGRSIQKTLV